MAMTRCVRQFCRYRHAAPAYELIEDFSPLDQASETTLERLYMPCMIWIAAGPITITKIAGKMQNTIGIIIFTGAF